MVSEYEYITVAELEAYSGIDYSGVDALFTNAVIEEQISTQQTIDTVIKLQFELFDVELEALQKKITVSSSREQQSESSCVEHGKCEFEP